MSDIDKDAGPDLDAVFAAARANPPRPDPALIDRVLADADAETGRMRLAPRPRAVQARAGRPLAELLGLLGGWRGLGGLATATLAGVWIGSSGAVGDVAWVNALLSDAEDMATIELMPGAPDFVSDSGVEG